MKVGLSFSRCVADIFDGKVDIDDVLVVISRTDIDPTDDSHWSELWYGYRQGIWSRAEWSKYQDTDEAAVREIAVNLYTQGKLHQPRQFGTYVSRRPEIWLETVLPSSELDRNPAAKSAWNQFQMVAGLTNVTLDYDYK